MIYLMYGFIGSGKTTKAKELEIIHNAVRFTPDEWMSEIFGHDPPEAIFNSALNGLLNKLNAIAVNIGIAGVNVILDYGFWSKDSRDDIENRLKLYGLEYEWIICEKDIEVCRKRNRERNRNGNELNITDETFEKLLEKYEPILNNA